MSRFVFCVLVTLLLGACIKPEPLQFADSKTNTTDILKAPAIELVIPQDLEYFRLDQGRIEIELGRDVSTIIRKQLAKYFERVSLVDTPHKSSVPQFVVHDLFGFVPTGDMSLVIKVEGEYVIPGQMQGVRQQIHARGNGNIVSAVPFLGKAFESQALSKAQHVALQDFIDKFDIFIKSNMLASGDTQQNYQSQHLVAESSQDQTKNELITNIPQGQTAGRFDVAVIVGNSDYLADGVPNVDYALNDAQAMRKYLEKTLGYQSDNILYLENATFAEMNQTFGSERSHRGKLYNFLKAGESKVFIYYAGHGAPDLDTGEAYFVPVDADPQYLSSSGYRLQTFYDNIAKLPARDVTIVLDSCFSGGSQKGMLFKGISPAMVKVEKETIGPKNALIFTSGRSEQVSTWYPEKGHSLFTYYFLKGLQGEADKNNNKTLTVAEMEGYLTENVPYMARRLSGREQNPSVTGKRQSVLAILK